MRSFILCSMFTLVASITLADEKSAGSDARKSLTSKTTGMKLAPIPGGTFLMGASDEDLKPILAKEPQLATVARSWQPQHQVELSPFYMGVSEVTQADYKKVMGKNPAIDTNFGRKESLQSPIDSVSWFDAIDFCNKLSQKDGLTPCYTLKNPKKRQGGSIESGTVTNIKGTGYRLPTEAEWEYACRAGTTTRFNTGDTLTDANTGFSGVKNPVDATSVKVRTYKPNKFGLYDMHGNNAEFCFDNYNEKAYAERSGSTKDPIVTTGEENRVVRGGKFESEAWQTYSFSRMSMPVAEPWGGIGFRIVKD